MLLFNHQLNKKELKGRILNFNFLTDVIGTLFRIQTQLNEKKPKLEKRLKEDVEMQINFNLIKNEI